jgi:hypothetical protein
MRIETTKLLNSSLLGHNAVLVSLNYTDILEAVGTSESYFTSARLHGAISQKAAIFIFAAMRTSQLSQYSYCFIVGKPVKVTRNLLRTLFEEQNINKLIESNRMKSDVELTLN